MDQPWHQTMVEKAVQGDAQAFAALLEAHYDRIHALAWKFCGNATEAEDVAQDVCVKLGKAILGFKGQSAFTTWLYRITLNTARDYLRRRKPTIELDAVPEIAATGEAADKGIEREQLWQLVRALPARQRDAVLLVYAEEMTHAQAADVLDCPEGTVSWAISEAKKQLKDWLKSDD